MSAGPAVHDPIHPLARRHGWWVCALVVVPLVCGLAGRWLIFHLFGNGSFIPAGTTGFAVIEWWDRGNGRFLAAGMMATAISLAARRQPLLAVAAGALAAGLTLVVEI